MMKIGSHVSNNGDLMLLGGAMEAVSYDEKCFMVYMGPPQNTFRKPPEALRSIEAISYAEEHGIKKEDIIVHAPYIVNLGQSDHDKFEYAVRFLTQEMVNVGLCNLKYVVLHPGAHMGQGVEYGIKRIASGLNRVLTNTSKYSTVILLETMAGKGTECGKTFEEIAAIINFVKDKNRIGVCLDTCHIYDGGYDIVNDYEGVMQQFDDIIGFNYLKAIHINDSKNLCGDHKDRHENFGFGNIGFATLMKFIDDERFENIPKLLETPYIPDPVIEKKSYPPYKAEIQMIKSHQFDENLKEKIIMQK